MRYGWLPRLHLAVALLAGCAAALPAELAAESVRPTDLFFTRLTALCGQRFSGRLVTADAADAEMRGKPMVMHVRDCSPTEIRIPFRVGEDASRTWVVTRTGEGVRLKHEHRHADGTEDERSKYGGDARLPALPTRIEFPADAFSRAMFVRQGIAQSAANVWALELRPDVMFAYELRRPGRRFRVEFDLRSARAG